MHQTRLLGRLKREKRNYIRTTCLPKWLLRMSRQVLKKWPEMSQRSPHKQVVLPSRHDPVSITGHERVSMVDRSALSITGSHYIIGKVEEYGLFNDGEPFSSTVPTRIPLLTYKRLPQAYWDPADSLSDILT